MSHLDNDSALPEIELTPDQHIRFKILVPLVSKILMKRQEERGSLTRADESKIYDKAIAAIQSYTERSYLDRFEYADWETGDDDRLRLGDFIYCNHQEPVNGYERGFEGQIVEHHVNKLPIILYNLDPKEPDNSGEYVDLQSLMMDGWTFTRLARLTQNSKGPKDA